MVEIIIAVLVISGLGLFWRWSVICLKVFAVEVGER